MMSRSSKDVIRLTFLIFAYLSTGFFALAESSKSPLLDQPKSLKTLSASMHGDRLAVSYEVLNTGKHILVVKESTGHDQKGKAQFTQRQVVPLNIQRGEALASHYGFQCSNQNDETVYAIVSRQKAKPEGEFQPERAWFIDQKNFQLVPVENLYHVHCHWVQNGESTFPF